MAETLSPDRPAGELVVSHSSPGRNLPAGKVRRLAECVLEGEGISFSYVGIVLARRDEVHRMNREFLDHDYATDVLSFVLSGSGEPLEGEVYVDLDMAAERAPEFQTGFKQEAARYVVHGLLHLAGHNDATDPEREAMRTLENRYLASCW